MTAKPFSTALSVSGRPKLVLADWWSGTGYAMACPLLKGTAKAIGSLIPAAVRWFKAAFARDSIAVIAAGCRSVTDGNLGVIRGPKLNGAGNDGLTDALGRTGVTANLGCDLAPCAAETFRGLRGGLAKIIQPPTPIRCAGAPQKALYLSADHRLRTGALQDFRIRFYTLGIVLSGVGKYGPALLDDIAKYGAHLHVRQRLTQKHGPARAAWFTFTAVDGTTETVETGSDMIHALLLQIAPAFVRALPLADAAACVDANPVTLRRKSRATICGLGGITNAPTTKTAAAAHHQSFAKPRHHVVSGGAITGVDMGYDQGGACLLTVGRSKMVLATCGGGGKRWQLFPVWLIDGTLPNRLMWLLPDSVPPPGTWKAMLRARQKMAKKHPTTFV